MKKANYEAPKMERMTVEVESEILVGSFSMPGADTSGSPIYG